MVEPPKRSRAPLLLRWLVLNLIRLVGVVAIAWAIGVQIALLIGDVRGATNQSADTSAQYSVSSPSNSSLGSSTAGILPLTSSKIVNADISKIVNSVPRLETQSVSPILSQILKPTDIIDVPDPRLIFASTSSALLEFPQPTAAPQKVPVVFYPDAASALPPSLPEGGIINLKKREEPAETAAQALNNASIVERYFQESTVPDQAGGLLFAVLQRALACLALLVLLPGQLGWPERFLIKHLHLLSMRSSGLALGSGKIWIGTDMQRHFVSDTYRLPGMLLLCSGGLDVLIAAFLIFQQSQKNKGQLVANREVYLRYHIAQRFLFWTNVPLEAFYSNDLFGLSQAAPGEAEKANMSQARPYAAEYPTFARGGLDDPESQIPDIHGEKPTTTHNRRRMETIDEETEDLSEEVVENTRLNARSSAPLQDARPPPHTQRIPPPQIPAEIAALPDSIQKMWKGVQPRFAANPGTTVPQIQLQPSTPSTIASGNQSIKFGRPDTVLSTSSVGSTSTDKSAQERSRLISGSARAFPVPPERAAAAHARSRPKSHLVNRRMDDTRLMPPKKSALRRHSQFASPPERRLSSEETEHISAAPDVPDDEQKKREEISRRSFVRFDLHRMSGCSTDSASSADSGLSDILPPKPAMSVEKSQPQTAEDFETMRRTESDSSIYSGIVQEVHRSNTTAATVTKHSSKLASPSRLSYLLTDESSPESPFSDIFAAETKQEGRTRQSANSAITVSTVYMSADENTGKQARIAPFIEYSSSDPLPCSHADGQEDFATKTKKRMSHLAV